jgi:hypothetical protein
MDDDAILNHFWDKLKRKLQYATSQLGGMKSNEAPERLKNFVTTTNN